MTNLPADLAEAKYVLLTTYRKDGTGVPTPVWTVARDGKLYVWTETASWKVKRIRRNPEVTLQRCNYRGVGDGPETRGTAKILDAAGTEEVRAGLNRKYWLTAPLLTRLSTLRRGKEGTIGIEITAGS